MEDFPWGRPWRASRWPPSGRPGRWRQWPPDVSCSPCGSWRHLRSDATTVRVSNGDVVTTDGPFAETKEQMGGFFLVDCKDLDEAIEVASKIPGARHGCIEVRPIWEM